MIEGTDIEIVEVEQDATFAALLQLGQKFPLAHLPGQLQIGGGIFNQHAATQGLLYLLDLVAHVAQGGAGIGHRQQIVEVTPTNAAPAEMFGDPYRFDRRGQCRQLLQMVRIERVGRTKGHANAVKTDGVVLRQFGEHLKTLAVPFEVIFTVHLQPTDCRQGLPDLIVMGSA